MQTTPETAALLAELYERSSIVSELDGPQIEAWVSGLFAIFDNEATAAQFVAYCGEQASVVGSLICAAVAELATGIDPDLATAASAHVDVTASSIEVAQIGASVLAGAWRVEAPFGFSIVLGFDNAAPVSQPTDVVDEVDPDAIVDLRHSALIEIGRDGSVQDIQLAGPATSLIEEAEASEDRVEVTELDTGEAIAQLIAAWPTAVTGDDLGPGLVANQQFVRRRVQAIATQVLPFIMVSTTEIDVQRGLDDAGFADANRAALSTLQAAMGNIEANAATVEQQLGCDMWASVIRGDAGELAPRERDALLWLEWADWLGAGIGLLRAGVDAEATGTTLVDYVNRCPEVSSSIDKADRDYAEWAFAVALDLLADVGAVDDERLTPDGYAALGPAMLAAWSPPAQP